MVAGEVIEAFDLGEATAFLCAVREQRALAGEAPFRTADVHLALGEEFARAWEEKRARDVPLLRELMHWKG